VRRRDRDRRIQEAAALDKEHAELRARLLAAVERAEQYTADLLAEVTFWQHARDEDTPSAQR
jgi:hypothetical protein